MSRISRICVVAKPTRNHREFREWERADVVVFAQADDLDTATRKAREVLARERWELLEIELCDRLIDEAIRAQGGDVLDLYNEAIAKGSAYKVFPKNFAAGRNGIAAIRPPRVGEEFIDQVVADVGGKRLPTDDKNRIVDYRIDDWIFELKDLQEEGLLQPERQKKVADLFAPYATGHQPLLLV